LSRKTGLIVGFAFAIVLLAILTYGMLSLRRYRAEVCITWNNRRDCKIASGATRAEALRTATESACSLLAAGMTDLMSCERSTPASVKWLSE
jgi:hypothetical protein